tara:strand:- start:748 stop:1074 length:327 start_codon:yes stop_codon:yes gene_type:complete
MKIFLIFVSFISSVFAADITQLYKVEGMHCSFGCATTVKTVVTSMDGIKSCDVDFDKSLMTVVFDDKKMNSEQIISSLNDKTTFKTTEIDKVKKTFWSKFKNMFKDKS